MSDESVMSEELVMMSDHDQGSVMSDELVMSDE